MLGPRDVFQNDDIPEVMFEQMMNAKYDHRCRKVMPSYKETQQIVDRNKNIIDYERTCWKHPDLLMCISLKDYINALIVFSKIDSTIWKQDELMHVIQDKMDKYGVKNDIPVSQHGRWIDPEFKKGIDRIVYMVMSKYMPFYEAFVVALYEHHTNMMRNIFGSVDMNDIEQVSSMCLQHPEYIEMTIDMRIIKEFYRILNTFDCELWCKEKTNEVIIDKFYSVFKAFRLPRKFPYALSQKFQDLRKRFTNEKAALNAKFEMQCYILRIFKDTHTNNLEKMAKLHKLLPVKDVLAPLYVTMFMSCRQCTKLAIAESNGNESELKSLEIDFGYVMEILHREYLDIARNDYLEVDFMKIIKDPKHELHQQLMDEYHKFVDEKENAKA